MNIKKFEITEKISKKNKSTNKSNFSKIKRAMRSRNWVFTDFEMLNLKQVGELTGVRAIGYGLETCPKTKKQHQQGWIQLEYPASISTVKKAFLGPKTHLEVMKGNVKQNITYCSKEKQYKQCGTPTSTGSRTDWGSILTKIRARVKMIDIAEEWPSQYLRYHTGMAKYKQLCDCADAPKWRNIKVIVHEGYTGMGKTKLAMNAGTDEPYMIEGGQMQWFDDYQGETTLVIDEYANQIPITKLLSLLDGYKRRIPVKQGFTYARWTTVYITTNLSELHPQADQGHKIALNRRITDWLIFHPNQKITKKIMPQIMPQGVGNTTPHHIPTIESDCDSEYEDLWSTNSDVPSQGWTGKASQGTKKKKKN